MVRQRLTSLNLGPGAVILLVALAVFLALLPVAFFLRSGVASDLYGHRVLNVTVAAVWCPHSIIVGWTLGHDWSHVTNVVTCPPGSLPAAWLQLWWRNGERTVVCVDFHKQRC